MTLLQARALEIAVGDRLLTQNLDLQVDRGEFWCVLGKNGAGKTTLLQVIAGLRSSLKGQIELCGGSLQSTPLAFLAQRRGLMMQQQVDVFPHTVFANVAIAHVAGCVSSNSVDASVTAALKKVGMAGSEDRSLLTLSGGERQRVALAALLVQAPELMLLDEPMSHQDVAQQLQVMQLLRELSTNHAVISSCHDINLARRFATHALVLGEGQHWLGLVGDTLVPEILRQAFGCEFVQQGDWLVPFQAHATGAI
ncbi:MAG: ABC transporter ATP-binding protein [Betaproteobacteria bacterium]|nr:ABC transporter ATP-binding protein [Betaproteobacteria bacterium]